MIGALMQVKRIVADIHTKDIEAARYPTQQVRSAQMSSSIRESSCAYASTAHEGP